MVRTGQTKLAPLLLAVVEQLKAEISGLEESTCFISLNPDDEPADTPGSLWITVSPGGGQFDKELWTGGGREQATVDTTFTVAVHSPVQLDQKGRDVEVLTNESLGVLQMLDQVIDTLSGWDYITDLGDPTEETHTRDPLVPSGWTYPQRPTDRHGWIGMVFEVKFDWEMQL